MAKLKEFVFAPGTEKVKKGCKKINGVMLGRNKNVVKT
jgi:hypothetical protein